MPYVTGWRQGTPVRGLTRGPAARALWAALLVLALATAAAPPAEKVHAGPPRPALVFTPSARKVAIGAPVNVTIDVTDVAGLYGCQFEIDYDPAMLSATGTLTDTLLDPLNNAYVPDGWNASCSAGVCKVAVTRLNPAPAVSGSGSLARITFIGRALGSTTMTIGRDVLTDLDGEALDHDVAPGALEIFPAAEAGGAIRLQGRPELVDSGAVRFTDPSAFFPDTTAMIDAGTGEWSAIVPVLPGGTTYDIVVGHALYLATTTTQSLAPHDVYAAPATTLKGGDANNNGIVDVSDLSCIGANFDGAQAACYGAATSGNTDINADQTTNIQDLALTAGNYGATRSP